MKKRWLDLAVCLALLLGDQWSKQAVATHLKNAPPLVLIPQVLELHYVENRGMAFGFLQGQIPLLLLGTLLLLGILLWLYSKVPLQPRFALFRIGMAVLAAGALGNMIDRIARGFVVDFIYFKPINFPSFNLADCCVVLSLILLAILYLFVYKDGEPFAKQAQATPGNAGEKE